MASSDLIQGNEAFGKRLYSIIARDDGNLICSPLSAHMVLSMAAAGAEAETKAALLTGLGIKDPLEASVGYEIFLNDVDKIKSNVTLNLANKIFVMKSFELKPEFNGIMRKNYRSEAQALDFAQNVQSAKIINTWVEEKTNNKIRDLIQPDSLTVDTRLVLVNAIYFKGNWAKQFKKEDTTEEPFHLLDGTEVKCNMMNMYSKFAYMEDETLKSKVLKLDYANDAVSMLVFLPTEINGLKHLEENIHKFDFQNYKNNMMTMDVTLKLPKFKIETEIKLTDVLKKMGMEIMFGPKANFSNIAINGEKLRVSEVIQKAFIEVNEEGAEAAAATAVLIMKTSAVIFQRRYEFVADHPFLVALIQRINNNNVVLFVGRLTNPN